MKEIYLDYASTTPVDPKVLKEMVPYMKEKFGNPSSFHGKGKETKEAIKNSRSKIAKILHCNEREIIFTSGGTESINFALKGVAFANKSHGNHIITSKMEHHAVLDSCKYLEKNGFKVTYLDVDKYGFVNPDDVEKAITDKTILISIMYSNNEIGTIEPIAKIGKIARSRGICFHTDACQATGFLNLNVSKLNVDLMTLNGSKSYGPKGIGILYVRKDVKIEPFMHGGGQEFGMRSGTENIAGIVGFAKALEIVEKNKIKEGKRLERLRNIFISRLLEIPKSRLNGPTENRLPNNVNISFLDIEGESMLLYLNEKRVYASTGSACASHSLESSHVLSAIGLPYEASHGSIRFSLGKNTTRTDVEFVSKLMLKIVKKLRAISPLNLNWEHFK